MNRKRLLSVSSELIKDIHDKISVKRFRTSEHDNAKLQYMRVLIQALQTHNQILKDGELEDAKERLDRLEQEIK